MARTVADAAVLLGVLAGVDPRDAATAASQGQAHADYTQFLDPNGLKGARIGVPRERFFGYHPADRRARRAGARADEGAGRRHRRPGDHPHRRRSWTSREFEVLLYEFKADLDAYLAGLGDRTRGADARGPHRVQRGAPRHARCPTSARSSSSRRRRRGRSRDKKYRKALEACRQLSRAQGIDAVMTKHKLDALVAPDAGARRAHRPGATATTGWAAAPRRPPSPATRSITVPAGYVLGLPVGISFIGRAWSEPTLLQLAYAFEQATPSTAARPPSPPRRTCA